jgi:hypothetical protein
MKRISVISTLFAAILAMSSCSKEYLNTTPTSSVSTASVFENTDAAKYAVNGLAKLMSSQYLGVQGMNGEGTIKMWYGNYHGAHFSIMNLPGWSTLTDMTYVINLISQYLYYPWYYYYRIIGNANTIIGNIDNAAGPESEKQYIKAQALSYRAYAYMMLAQMYCLRWSDSQNGASLGLILRIDESDGDMARSTLAETYGQIYKDLDDAIGLYKESGLHRDADLAKSNYIMDIEAAYAIYARAALNKQDYANAEAMAQKARENYPLMSVADYKAGFANPTSEWIWSVWGSEDETLYFYSYFAYIAYNADASQVRSYPKCISKELFEKIPDSDIRKGLFLNPADTSTNANYTYNKATGLANNAWRDNVRSTRGTASAATVYAWMQFKIKVNAQAGVGNMNNFRSSEMALIEAEAQYFQGRASDAQATLVELNATSGRDPSYTCTKTGADLLDEIKTYRALELWGEGFDWFDLKRWGDPLARRTFPNGNFHSSMAVTIQPQEKNKWTWYIPARELDYNKLAVQNNYSE